MKYKYVVKVTYSMFPIEGDVYHLNFFLAQSSIEEFKYITSKYFKYILMIYKF